MQIQAIILAAAETSPPGSLPLLIALAATILALVALIRVSSIGQQLKQPAQAGNAHPVPTPSPTAPAPAPAAPDAGAIPPEIVAVIAAAVATCAGKNIRIVSIKPASSSWERAGRQSVLTSHRIR